MTANNYLLLTLGIGLSANFAIGQGNSVDVSNIQASQIVGGQNIAITYDLAYSGSQAIRVTLEVSDDGGATYDVPVNTISGAVGRSDTIQPGTDLMVVWNAGADWPGGYTEQATIRLTATEFDPTLTGPPTVVPEVELAPQLIVTELEQQIMVPAGLFIDDEEDPITISAVLANDDPLPGWLSFDPATLTFTAFPGRDDFGLYQIKLVAMDPYDPGQGTSTFDLEVEVPTSPPTVENPIADQTFDLATTFTLTVPENTIVDPDGETITYTAQAPGGGSLPSWLSFDSQSRELTAQGVAASHLGQIVELVGDDGFDDPVTTTFTVTGVPPTGYSFAEAGTFTMGSPTSEPGRDNGSFDSELQRTVTLTRSFLIKSTEVTTQEFVEVYNWALDQGYISISGDDIVLNEPPYDYDLANMSLVGTGVQYNSGSGNLEAIPGRENFPINLVTWFGATAYVNFLSEMEGLPRSSDWQTREMDPDSLGYRLPYEAEWEFACRAGTTTAFYTGPITIVDPDPTVDPNLNTAGWYIRNSTHQVEANKMSAAGNGSFPVAQKAANAWGLYDMHGNIEEWCADRIATLAHSGGTVTDPFVYDTAGTARAIRGGHWFSDSQNCRSARRWFAFPSSDTNQIGFRTVRTVPN